MPHHLARLIVVRLPHYEPPLHPPCHSLILAGAPVAWATYVVYRQRVRLLVAAR